MAAAKKRASAAAGLEKLLTKIENAVELAVNLAANTAHQSLKSTTRFNDRTGNLRASFQIWGSQRFHKTIGVTGGPMKYAGFVEFGTKFIRARRFAAMAGTYAEVALMEHMRRRLAIALSGK